MILDIYSAHQNWHIVSLIYCTVPETEKNSNENKLNNDKTIYLRTNGKRWESIGKGKSPW